MGATPFFTGFKILIYWEMKKASKRRDKTPLRTMLKIKLCNRSSSNLISNIKQTLVNKLFSISPGFVMIFKGNRS